MCKAMGMHFSGLVTVFLVLLPIVAVTVNLSWADNEELNAYSLKLQQECIDAYTQKSDRIINRFASNDISEEEHDKEQEKYRQELDRCQEPKRIMKKAKKHFKAVDKAMANREKARDRCIKTCGKKLKRCKGNTDCMIAANTDLKTCMAQVPERYPIPE